MGDQMSRKIVTFTGRAVDPVAPAPEDICIEDIAHALAYLNRYTGHGRFVYSVGIHSCWVADLVRTHGGNPLHGLLHDAAEAYLGDLNWAVKAAVQEVWEPLETSVMGAIYTGLGLTPPTPEEATLVKWWDTAVRGSEGIGLFGEDAWLAAGGSPHHPETGKVAFLASPEVERLFLVMYQNCREGRDLWATL